MNQIQHVFEEPAIVDSVPSPGDSLAVDEVELVTVIRALQRESRWHRLKMRLYRGFIISYVGLPIVIWGGNALLRAIGISIGHLPEGWANWFGAWYVFGFTGYAYASKSYKEATSRAAELEDIRAVGPLIESLQIDDRSTRAVAEAALTRLLPQIKASDVDLLTDTQRQGLYRVLRHGSRRWWCYPADRASQIKLVDSALKAIAQIGDSRAIPEVERLSRGEGIAVISPRLVEEARACLPVLKERVAGEQARSTLLRPAENSPDSDVLLLRPAHGAESDSSSLVRPVF